MAKKLKAPRVDPSLLQEATEWLVGQQDFPCKPDPKDGTDVRLGKLVEWGSVIRASCGRPGIALSFRTDNHSGWFELCWDGTTFFLGGTR